MFNQLCSSVLSIFGEKSYAGNIFMKSQGQDQIRSLLFCPSKLWGNSRSDRGHIYEQKDAKTEITN